VLKFLRDAHIGNVDFRQLDGFSAGLWRPKESTLRHLRLAALVIVGTACTGEYRAYERLKQLSDD
jgi:hypothetical protein